MVFLNYDHLAMNNLESFDTAVTFEGERLWQRPWMNVMPDVISMLVRLPLARRLIVAHVTDVALEVLGALLIVTDVRLVKLLGPEGLLLRCLRLVRLL